MVSTACRLALVGGLKRLADAADVRCDAECFRVCMMCVCCVTRFVGLTLCSEFFIASSPD